AALDFYSRLPGDNRKDIATSLHNLALSKDWQGQLAAADSLYRESLRIQREVYGKNNDRIALTIGNLGFVAESRGDFAEAEQLFRESLVIRRSLLSDTHTDVVANKIKLGLFLIDHGARYAEAEQLCREALGALLSHNPNLTRLLARAYLGIGRATAKQGKLREGEQALRKSVAYFSGALPLNPTSIADAELSLAENLISQRRFREAKTQLLQTQALLKNASADSSSEMLKTNELLVSLYQPRK
ncbi:MAG: tetratricopeptide repeat protein, partial [bacterium]